MHHSYQSQNRIGGIDNADDALHSISRSDLAFVYQVIASQILIIRAIKKYSSLLSFFVFFFLDGPIVAFISMAPNCVFETAVIQPDSMRKINSKFSFEFGCKYFSE